MNIQMRNSLWLWCFEALLESERRTITIMNTTSRCSSRCSSRCAIHYGYRAWTFPYFSHFSTLFQNFSSRTSLKIKAFLEENQKNKTKPFCRLVVARLSSSSIQKRPVKRFLMLGMPDPYPCGGDSPSDGWGGPEALQQTGGDFFYPCGAWPSAFTRNSALIPTTSPNQNPWQPIPSGLWKCAPPRTPKTPKNSK